LKDWELVVEGGGKALGSCGGRRPGLAAFLAGRAMGSPSRWLAWVRSCSYKYSDLL